VKATKIILGLIVSYIGVVVIFESMLGYFQPENQSTFIITTMDEKGQGTERVLVQNHLDGKLYASANHWPRAWYKEALRNPRVKANINGVTAEYIAVPIDAAEHESVDKANPHGMGFKILIGFAPREFVRLDPVLSNQGS